VAGRRPARASPALALLALACAVCACAAAAPRANDQRDLSAYTGLATWVDLYDPHVLAAPETAVAEMAGHGVQTLFLQTSNYQMRHDIVRPDRVGRFLEAAHADGMQVVAWYLPSFVNLARDQRRSLAAINFRSSTGDQFDSFALDIESSVVRSAPLRSARLVLLSKRLRAAVPNLTLGAIVPSPLGMQRLPWYWPGFPFIDLAQTYDVFLPMGYFTYRSKQPGFSGTYTRRNIVLLREWTGNPELPVHAIGGIASYASAAQVRTFVQAARAKGAIGSSLYDFAGTTARQWRELRASNLPLTTG
jgi:hypothetical protein